MPVTQSAVFAALHHTGTILALPNPWDVTSAIILERCGYAALGTTSAGIAFSLGYRDGEELPFEELLTVVAAIVRKVSIPVSVDMESGYASNLSGLTENIKKLIDAGVAGINIEDDQKGAAGVNLYPIEEQQKRIEAIRNTAIKADNGLFINARTEIYLKKVPVDDPLGESIRRAEAFKQAGADGFFIPGITDLETIKSVRSQVTLPINILAAGPSISELQAIGINRLSFGSLLYRHVYSELKRSADAFQETKDYSALLSSALPYDRFMSGDF
ncbi:MAG: isocitrate lyase/phosphoenolpyruvate mutase family protein [Flavitalea sp.]